ncbi:MAG: histidine kinase N-terminal 7TM domain-containing protein [Mariniphaga sp.]
MNQIFTIYSILFLATALVSFFGAILAWQRRAIKGAKELAMLLFAAGIWAFWIIFETSATTVTDKIFYAKFGYFGAVSTPVFYLIFVLRFVGKDKYLTLKNKIILFLIPLITLVIAFTNEFHHLLWSGFSTISAETNLMEYYHGIWFWIGYFGFNYTLSILSTIYLIRFIMVQTRTFSSQGWIVLAASLIPWSASVLYLSGKNPVAGLDLVPVSTILSGLLFTYAILYINFLDIIPVARQTLVETLTDGILVLDRQNRIQDINEAAIHFLGIRDRNIIGYPIESAGASVTQLLLAVLDSIADQNIEIGASGSVKTYSVGKKEIKNQQDSRLVLIRDITSLIDQQREIQESNKRYRLLSDRFRLMSDNMSDMLWAKDLEKKFIFINKAACENLLLALNTDEPIGKDHLFFADRARQEYPENPNWYNFGEQCQNSDEVVMSSGKAERFEEYGNVNGNFLFLDVRKAPIFDETGLMIGVVGSARDVTLQKKTEADVIERDILLGAVAKATALLVQGEDLDDSIKGALEIVGKATLVNRVYIFQNHLDQPYQLPMMSQRYEWTDGSVKEEIGNPELQSLPYEIAFPRWYEVLTKGEVIVGNIRNFPEGERLVLESQGIVSILVTPVFIANTFWGYVGFDDCKKERIWTSTEERLLSAAANTFGAAYSQKKNKDELVVAKQKAEESDRLKSAFLATMNHELRTPLNHILGFSELILSGAMPDDNIAFASNINHSGKELLAIVEDVFDLALAEHSNIKLRLQTFRLMDQFMENKSIFDQIFQTSGKSEQINLVYKPDAQLLSWYLTTDRSKVNQILINLFKNAIKFTNTGLIEYGFNSHKKGSLTFFIRDTGIGIPKEKQSLIFDFFRQGDDSPTRVYGGIGIGLSIASKISKILNGQLSVVSEPEKGSIFSLTIPVELTDVVG